MTDDGAMDYEKQLVPTRQYSLFAKILHWGFVVLFIYGILKQVDNIAQLANVALLRFELLFAFVLLVLLAARFGYMTKTQVSSLPKETPYFQKLLARLVHLGMYLALSSIALSGILIGLLYWMGIKTGFFIALVIYIHEVSVTVCYWLIGLHVAAAIFHRLKNDGVWSSMVPVWKENTTK